MYVSQMSVSYIHCELHHKSRELHFLPHFSRKCRTSYWDFQRWMMYFILQIYFSDIHLYVVQIVETIWIHEFVQFLSRSCSDHNQRHMTTNPLNSGRFRTNLITKHNFTGYNNHKMREWSKSSQLIQQDKKWIIR